MPGADKIGAAISGPRIAGGDFSGHHAFLNYIKYKLFLIWIDFRLGVSVMKEGHQTLQGGPYSPCL